MSEPNHVLEENVPFTPTVLDWTRKLVEAAMDSAPNRVEAALDMMDQADLDHVELSLRRALRAVRQRQGKA